MSFPLDRHYRLAALLSLRSVPTLPLTLLALDLLLALLPTLTSVRTVTHSRLIDLDGYINGLRGVLRQRARRVVCFYFSCSFPYPRYSYFYSCTRTDHP
jgi:hypothetical protein